MKNKFFMDHLELNVSDYHSVQDGWYGPVPVIKIFWSPFADQFLGELTQSQFDHPGWAVIYAAGLEGRQDIDDYEYLWIIRSEHKAALARYLNIDKDKLFINFTQNNNEVIHA